MTVTITVDPGWNVCDWAPQYGPTQPLGQAFDMATTCSDDQVLYIAVDLHNDSYACARHQDQMVCAIYDAVPCRSMTQPLGRES